MRFYAFFVTFSSDEFWIKKTCHFRKILINLSVFFVNTYTYFSSHFSSRIVHTSVALFFVFTRRDYTFLRIRIPT